MYLMLSFTKLRYFCSKSMVKLCVISGGTATNSILDALQNIGGVSYILPVSDNGGSTSEIIRVLGGCGVGDIRSRLTRLIPHNNYGIKELLNYRLPVSSDGARREWDSIVDGTHKLWNDIESSVRELLRSFLIHVHMEILKRSRLKFKLELASVGNLFLTGARLFCGDLDSAIELVLRICRIREDIKVMACINTNFTYHIGAILKDGTIITGQSQISHPSISPNSNIMELSSGSVEDLVGVEDIPSYIHPELQKSQLHFNKDDIPPLASPIERIFYVSPYGEEIHPMAQNRVSKCLDESDVLIYSIGSLMTSIVPVLILRGVGKVISSNNRMKKVLLLNGKNDRETFGMGAFEFLESIRNALIYSGAHPNHNLRSFVTHLVYIAGNVSHETVPVDVAKIQSLGVECLPVKRDDNDLGGYDLVDLQRVLESL